MKVFQQPVKSRLRNSFREFWATMEIRQRVVRGWQVLDVSGEVMYLEIQPFRDTLRAAMDSAGPGARFLLNFSECEHIGSVGLGTLIEMNKQLRLNGGELKIIGLDETARFRLEPRDGDPPFLFIDSEEEI